MSGYTLAMVMAVGTALLALWLHVRFPRLCPENVIVVGIHVVLALVLLHGAPVALGAAAADPATKLLAITGFLYPALTYMFLTTAWMIQVVQSHLPGARR